MWPDWAIYCTLGNFLKDLATIILPNFSTFLDNFCKGVKIIHFWATFIDIWRHFIGHTEGYLPTSLRNKATKHLFTLWWRDLTETKYLAPCFESWIIGAVHKIDVCSYIPWLVIPNSFGLLSFYRFYPHPTVNLKVLCNFTRVYYISIFTTEIRLTSREICFWAVLSETVSGAAKLGCFTRWLKIVFI